ncbi:MAG: hypothetical protein ACI4OS_00600 [Akkermansia sp.]
MSPRSMFLCTLLGVLAAGAPLPYLLQHRAAAPAAAREAREAVSVPVSVFFDGRPLRMRLRHGGQVLAEMPPDEPAPWLPVLSLPASGAAEVELEAEWAEPGWHGVTLRAEPPGRPTVTAGDWQQGTQLHTLFRFTW